MITAFCSSYVRPTLVGHSVPAVWYLPLGAACLPACRSVVSSSNWRYFRGPQMFLRLYAQNPSWSSSSFADLVSPFPSLTVCSVVYSLQFFIGSTLHNGFRRRGFYLYIGLILSGYNVPLAAVFVNCFCLILCTKNCLVFWLFCYLTKVNEGSEGISFRTTACQKSPPASSSVARRRRNQV